jgi:3',5'-cyclic AMP phosphodiesterase CpdA
MRRFTFANDQFAGALIVALGLAACVGVTAPPAPSSLPALAAAGLRVYAAGDIADCGNRRPGDSAAALTAGLVPAGAFVLGLGDMAYPYADAETLASCYQPTWGRHRATTIATPGNHDYVNGSAQDFLQYFSMPPAHEAGFVAFTRRLTDEWLLIALDSNVTGSALQAQYEWLERTLEREWDVPQGVEHRESQRCLLVMWHAPLYSSGLHRGSGEHMRPFWRLLDAHDADLVLSGHEHFYEQFAPLDADGNRLRGDSGLRQFVVGTGGARLYGFWRPPYLSRARVLDHGVLQLSLEPGRYSWQFVDVAGRVRDTGAARCRAAGN